MTVTAEAPAKINLTLSVTGKRADGYHLLRSVMQTVSLYDTVAVTLTDTGRTEVICSLPELGGEQNIAARAVRIFREAVGKPLGGIHIDITKRIPLQAGLGGGSADAAAVLAALNRLTDARLSAGELEALGARVGADVPFCLRGGTALAEGIGERLTSLSAMPACFVLLAKNGSGVSTPEAYRRLDESTVPVPDTADELCRTLAAGDLNGLAAATGNVFEAALALPEPEALCRSMERAGALAARLTGSGSAVFGIFTDKEAARSCAERLPPGTWTALCSPCAGIRLTVA